MMTPLDLTLAVLALLVTPGPTNTLVLLAGAERGFLRALRLIPAELAGYFCAILPLVFLGTSILAAWPRLHSLVALGAALWVALLAVRLWGLPDATDRARGVDARTLFMTTALNPKALIFGLVILPSPDRLETNLLLFASLVVAVALLWAGLGALLRGGAAGPAAGQPPTLHRLRRLASVWLGAVSVLLVLRGMTA